MAKQSSRPTVCFSRTCHCPFHTSNPLLQLLSGKRDDLATAKDRLLNGLGKLSETNSLVDRMKAELAGLQPILESKSRATADLLVKVRRMPPAASAVTA